MADESFKDRLLKSAFVLVLGAILGVVLLLESETFVWKENKKESKKDQKTTVTYTYEKVWSKDEKPPTKFAEKEGHANPDKKPYADAKLSASGVKVGAFTLTAAQVERLV